MSAWAALRIIRDAIASPLQHCRPMSADEIRKAFGWRSRKKADTTPRYIFEGRELTAVQIAKLLCVSDGGVARALRSRRGLKSLNNVKRRAG